MARVLRGYVEVHMTVKAQVDCHVSKSELRDFVKDALECWGGQRHPDDPLFGSLENVTVKFTNLA